jgi:hypothetical protein
VVWPAWRHTAWRTCDESQRVRAGQAAVSGQKRWRQTDAGTQQTTRHQGSRTAPDPLWDIPSCRTLKPDSDPQDRSLQTHGSLVTTDPFRT